MRLQIPITFWALAVAGCAAVGVHAPLDRFVHRDEFFPLHPGTLWVYEVHDSEGRVALERVLVRGEYRSKSHQTAGTIVEESGGLSGEFDFDVSWHPVVYYRRGPFLYKSSAVNYDLGGELRELPLGDGEEKVLPNDPREQRQWESDFDIFRAESDDGYRAKMVSVAQSRDEQVKVRAGVFRRCLRVDSESVLTWRSDHGADTRVTFHYVDWYAPGVGLVKSEVHADEGALPITTLELISFRDGRGHD